MPGRVQDLDAQPAQLQRGAVGDGVGEGGDAAALALMAVDLQPFEAARQRGVAHGVIPVVVGGPDGGEVELQRRGPAGNLLRVGGVHCRRLPGLLAGHQVSVVVSQHRDDLDDHGLCSLRTLDALQE